MPTIEELTAEAKKVAGERDAMKAENATLKSQLATTPDRKYIHRDASGNELGGWEETDESVEIVSGYQGDGPRAHRRMKSQTALKSLMKIGYEPHSQFKCINEFIREGLEGHSTSAFQDKHRAHFKSVENSPSFKSMKAIQGMSETFGADGGFTVMPEFNQNIFSRVYNNDIVSLTDGYTVAGNNMTFIANAETSRIDGSRAGGFRGYWAGEGVAGTSSKPTVRNIQMKLQKLIAIVYLTDELIADSGQALEQYVTKKASDEFNFLIGNSLFNGDGVGKPLGILNAPSLLAIAKESGQATKTVQTENIVKMYARAFAPFRTNMKFFHNQDVEQQLPLMTIGVGTGGQVTYLPPGGLSTAPYGMLQGRPLAPIEFAQTLGTQGDIILADMGQVLSISKGGIQQAVSMHVEFLTDQIALRFTMRFNAVPWENAPTTPYNGTNTQSSFVTLAAR